MKIYESLNNIMQDIEAIKKEKRNQSQGYQFRGIDDMYNSLHPLFKKHRVFIASNIISSTREERKTAKGGLLIYTIIRCEFSFIADDGSKVITSIEGEAMDSGDKSCNKAMSTALKYSLMQMFLIPTEERLDTEYESHEPVSKKTKITEAQYKKAIERINSGDLEVAQKCIDSFSLTADQKQALENLAAAVHSHGGEVTFEIESE